MTNQVGMFKTAYCKNAKPLQSSSSRKIHTYINYTSGIEMQGGEILIILDLASYQAQNPKLE